MKTIDKKKPNLRTINLKALRGLVRDVGGSSRLPYIPYIPGGDQ